MATLLKMCVMTLNFDVTDLTIDAVTTAVIVNSE